MRTQPDPRPRSRTLRHALAFTLATVPAVACNIASNLRLPDEGADRDGGPFVTGDGGLGGGADAVSGDASVIPVGDGGAVGDGAADDGEVTDAQALCPVNRCTGGNVCCYVIKSPTSGAYRCLASCPNGDPPVECAGPQHCGGASPYCCASVKLGPGNVPACTVSGIYSSCTGTCNPSLGLSCGITDTFRLCQQNSDCASDPAGNTQCCSYPGLGLTSLVCVSPLIRSTLSLPCAQ